MGLWPALRAGSSERGESLIHHLTVVNRSRTGPAQDVHVVSVTTWNRPYAVVKAGARSSDATTRPSSHGSKEPRVGRGELLRGRIGGIMTGLDAPDGPTCGA
jgi:hypothetical protein